ncbi:M56 family metallopeptidase [Paenibacillus sp. NPDC056722]|uniref:M56 family metallopeptidase n=1 Tax=Paenibacillus sp. NPDC056722 TaxID=3345924 RepID=UPI0036B54494
MRAFIITLLESSLTLSAIALVYITLTPSLSRRYSAKWRYYIWLVIIIGLLIPFRPHFALTPQIQLNPIELMPDLISEAGRSLLGAASNEILTINSNIWNVIAVLWFTGVCVVIAFHVLRHYRWMKMIARWSNDVEDQQIMETMQFLQGELGIRKRINIKHCAAIPGPMMSGLFKPVITLNSIDMTPEALNVVLKHELVHIKRLDLGYKALVLLATALHWFNPLVYLMAKAIEEQCELSCDEEVLNNASLEERRQYAAIIIDTAKAVAKRQTAITTHLYNGRDTLKKRIFALMDTRKKKRATSILIFVALCIFLTGGTINEFVVENIQFADSEDIMVATQYDSTVNDNESKQSQLSSSSVIEPEWYTYEEFKRWVEAELMVINKLVKTGEWTQEKADFAAETYKEILSQITQGARVSKPQLQHAEGTQTQNIVFISASE